MVMVHLEATPTASRYLRLPSNFSNHSAAGALAASSAFHMAGSERLMEYVSLSPVYESC